MGSFVAIKNDGFEPEYGEINWRERFEALKEEREIEMTPIGYKEEGKPVMQVNQENTVIYINQIADELDCVAVKYDQDEEDLYTFYFREKFESDEIFAHVVSTVGAWSMQVVTLYPVEHIVNKYEDFAMSDLNSGVPEEWL